MKFSLKDLFVWMFLIAVVIWGGKVYLSVVRAPFINVHKYYQIEKDGNHTLIYTESFAYEYDENERDFVCKGKFFGRSRSVGVNTSLQHYEVFETYVQWNRYWSGE